MVLPTYFLNTDNGPVCLEGCTFPFGLPDQTFNDFTTTDDGTTYTWRPGTLARDKPIFKIQESTSEPVLTTGPYSMYFWLKNQHDIPKAPEGAKVRIEPLAKKATDPYFEAYKVVAQECAKKCVDDADCTGVNPVLRVIIKQEIKQSDDPSGWVPVVDVYADSGMDHMAFACFAFDDSKVAYLRTIDTNHKVDGTRQFKPLDVDYTETDYSVLFSHYWTKPDYSVIPHGSSNEEATCYNPACTFPHGLPDESFNDFATSKDDITYTWRLGTLASDKPIFQEQESTSSPVFVTPPKSMWYWLDHQDQLPKGKVGHNIRFQLRSKKATDPYWNAYKVVAQECADDCQKSEKCAGVHPVMRIVKKHEIAHSDKSKMYSAVVNNKNDYADNWEDHVAFVCYGFDDEKTSYLRAIDTDHKVEGTRQFKPLDVEYAEPDYSVLFSHYWTKNDFNVSSTPSPPSTTSAIRTTSTKHIIDTKDTKHIVDTKDTKHIVDTKNTKHIIDTKDTKDIIDTKDTKDIIDTKDTKHIVDTKDTKHIVDTKDTKHIIDTKDTCFCDGIGSASTQLVKAVQYLGALQKQINDEH